MMPMLVHPLQLCAHTVHLEAATDPLTQTGALGKETIFEL